MSHHDVLRALTVAASAVLFTGCADSPARPTAASDAVTGSNALSARSSPGSYELSFHVEVGDELVEVQSLAVSGEELILKAHVEDAAGTPAQTGTVVFEYCSFKGRRNDITQPDEAPKEACELGLAAWTRLGGVSVDAQSCAGPGSGNACLTFGVVQIPRTVGFRFHFSAQRSSIAKGMSEAKDFTWQ